MTDVRAALESISAARGDDPVAEIENQEDVVSQLIEPALATR